MESQDLLEDWEDSTLISAVGGDGQLIVSGPFGSNLKVEHYRESGVPIVRLQNIGSGEFLNKDIKYISQEKAEELRYHSFKSGDLILAKLGEPIGKTCIVPDYIGDGIVVSDVVRIRNINPKLSSKYLMYLLNSTAVLSQLNSRVFGTTRQRVNLDDVRDLQIPLPPLPVQRRIVEILDQADALRHLRAQADAETQKLLQSVFYEMFGDPVRNEKGWDMKQLGDLIKSKKDISCGPFGSQLKIGEYVSNGIPVIGIDNVGINEFLQAKPKFITREKFLQLFAFKIRPNDVLISRTGTIGRTCIFPNNFGDAIIGPNLLRVSIDQENLLPVFLSIILNYTPYAINQLKQVSPGATVAVLNTENLRKIKIIVPPIVIQQQFSQIVMKIEELRKNQHQSTNSYDTLYNCLMAKAFTGNLN
jgi:type I restriction enzyme S subunit